MRCVGSGMAIVCRHRLMRPTHDAYVRLRGLGLIDALFCPHYNSEPRARSLKAMVSKYGGMGLGVDDNAAIEVAGDSFRVLSSAENAGVHRVYRLRGKVVTEFVEKPRGIGRLTACWRSRSDV